MNLLSAARDETAGRAPRTSLVLASRGEPAQLQRCLAAVREQSIRLGVEIVVARADDGGAVAAWAAEHPYARFVGCAGDASLAQLRAAGMRAAGGDIVAVTDDTSVPVADWLQKLVRAYQRPGQS